MIYGPIRKKNCGTDLRNFEFKFFGDFLNFKFGQFSEQQQLSYLTRQASVAWRRLYRLYAFANPVVIFSCKREPYNVTPNFPDFSFSSVLPLFFALTHYNNI